MEMRLFIDNNNILQNNHHYIGYQCISKAIASKQQFRLLLVAYNITPISLYLGWYNLLYFSFRYSFTRLNQGEDRICPMSKKTYFCGTNCQIDLQPICNLKLLYFTGNLLKIIKLDHWGALRGTFSSRVPLKPALFCPIEGPFGAYEGREWFPGLL